jgi:DNA-binding response OmpR family regulator
MRPARALDATGTFEPSAGDSGAGQVLVIEDEPGIADFLARGLRADGFQVLVERDGLDGESSALREGVDLVVLDLMLPRRSGLDVLASLRAAKPGVPVILLTAKGEVEDRVAGLNAGAVDYLVKPFSMAELRARIRAHLRTASQSAETRLEGEGVELDLLSRRVRRGGEEIALSTTEFELLAHLMRNRPRVLSREEILGAVWGYQHDPATNIVDVYIGYLRRKLRDGADEAPIQTIRSVGYRFGRVSG